MELPAERKDGKDAYQIESLSLPHVAFPPTPASAAKKHLPAINTTYYSKVTLCQTMQAKYFC